MGFAISWLAVRNTSDTSVLSTLGLEKTGETEEIPESDWCSARLGEWVIIWSNSMDPAKFRDAPSKLGGEVVVCHVEEHVMFASTSAFENGSLRWSVVHESEQARDNLEVDGTPPESFARVRAEEFAHVNEDRDVDFIFEIPIRMAEEVVGFRYDSASDPLFDTLRVAQPPKPKWKFW